MHGPWYDEAFDERGTVRPPYAALRRRTGRDPLRPTVDVAEQLRDRPFDDDTRIFPVPLVIDDTEYRTVIQPGLAQRVRALQRLFADLVIGPGSILTAGVGLTADLIEEILAVEGTSLARLRELWRRHDRTAIRFVYGPDLVRAPDGRWTILEDNLGCVGGSADSFAVTDRYRAATGVPGCPTCRPQPDLAVAVQRWLHRFGRHDRSDDQPGTAAVAVLGCEAGDGPWAQLLRENARRRLILDTLGIPVIERCRLDQWTDQHTGDAVAVVNFSVDESWSELFERPGVALLNAPGTGVLGNKALLPYLADVIRFYLREDPILSTPPTRLLGDGALPADTEHWVVKAAAGCQGNEVFVLGWLPRERLDAVEDLVRSKWSGAVAVAQRYVEPSRLVLSGRDGQGGWDGYRVEIRPVSYVLGWDEVHVAEQPVGKVVSSFDARRLNNISQGASYAAVLREPCRTCRNGA